MATVPYSKLKLKINSVTKEIDINNEHIEVKQYLSMQDKYDLIMITLQKAKEDKIYNPLKLDAYFHLHLIYLYTNLTFTDKQREDEMKLYDILQTNKVIEKVINAIPEAEYNYLYDMLQDYIANECDYNKSIGSIVAKIIYDLPKQADAMKKIIDTFDAEKYQEVIQFATAANGGRNIWTTPQIERITNEK